ncbi:matrix protein [Lake Chad virus]|uniref:Matrix protein n=1 Tax=Lake Chad virus TaxID=688438 RepID=A0A7T8EH14_9ORTO|nr:matrix protein [Lake Chad virus]QQO86217.1 matrix protein [Lake Chad virus]
MATSSRQSDFPSAEELSIGMARMTLSGDTVPREIFESVDRLADKMDTLSIDNKSKAAGLISVWVVNRYNPFRGATVLKSHLGCSNLKKIIYKADKHRCIRTAKAYIDRGAPPHGDRWETLFECAIGLLTDQRWGDDDFRAEVAKALIESTGGEVERAPTKPRRKDATRDESDDEEEAFEKVMERATKRLLEEASRQQKKRRKAAMDTAIELRDSFKSMTARGECFAKMSQGERTRWITTFSKCLQQILDLNEGARLYDYVKSIGSR